MITLATKQQKTACIFLLIGIAEIQIECSLLEITNIELLLIVEDILGFINYGIILPVLNSFKIGQ